ncbi:hypothetical protein Golax_012198, partial [Gossypium laxum]|nr:hypothetical protein [Gossypium laxum]
SWILRSTIKPLSSSSNSFTKDINFYVGDGKLIEFWFDIWIGSTLLKLAFPRIFALARKKEGNIHEFGSRVATIGSGLFPSEGLYLTGNSKWSPIANGFYNPKYFCDMLAMRGAPPDDIGDTFGEGCSPPKVEFFIWKLLHGRILTKLKLLKKGITSLSSTICALCLDEEESVYHLFVRVGSLEEFGKTGVVRGSEPVWNMSFFAIAWTIWLHLNEVVFNGKLCDLDQLYDLTVVRIGWCYAEWPGSVASTYEFLLGQSGDAVIRGLIIRKDKGVSLVTFSKSIGISDILPQLNPWQTRKHV